MTIKFEELVGGDYAITQDQYEERLREIRDLSYSAETLSYMESILIKQREAGILAGK